MGKPLFLRRILQGAQQLVFKDICIVCRELYCYLNFSQHKRKINDMEMFYVYWKILLVGIIQVTFKVIKPVNQSIV